MTKKNRKARRLQELHPEVKIRVFYQRDYLHLLMKYGLEPPSQLVGEGTSPPFWLAEPKQPDPDLTPKAEEPPVATGSSASIGEPPAPRRRRARSA